MPKTNSGKIAVWLMIIFALTMVVFQILIKSGQRGGQGFFDNLYLAIPGLIMAISGVLSFFVGGYSLIKEKDVSILVVISTLLGLLITLFVSGEILSPH